MGDISTILEVDPLALLNFDEKQFFNQCTQSGNIQAIHNNNFDNERQLYERYIAELQATIARLTAELSQQKL